MLQEDVIQIIDHLMDNARGAPGQPCLENDGDTLGVVYSGIATLRNERVPLPVYLAAKACQEAKPSCPVELLRRINQVDIMGTSSDGYATTMFVELDRNPFSGGSVDWLDDARKTLARLEEGGALGGIKVYLYGL